MDSKIKKETDMEDLPKRRKVEESGNTLIKQIYISYKNIKKRSVQCYPGDTLLTSIKNQGSFWETKETFDKDKLMIVNKNLDCAVPIHLPFSFITDGDEFDMTDIKIEKKMKTDLEESNDLSSYPVCSEAQGGQFTFFVSAKGEYSYGHPAVVTKVYWYHKNETKFLVYAYEGETLKTALERDGRFNSKPFEYVSYLKDQRKKEHDISNTHVHKCIKKKHFTLIVYKKSAPQTRKEQSDDNDKIAGAEKGVVDLKGMSSPCSSAAEQEAKAENQRGERHGNSQLYEVFQEKWKKYFEHEKKNKRSYGRKYWESLKQEFGKKVKDFYDVKTIKMVSEMSNSCCMIKVNDMQGSGFLLFNKYILTCYHLIGNGSWENSTNKVWVTFDFESETENCTKIDVTPKPIYCSEDLDYALMELKTIPDTKPLLDTLAVSPESEIVCIIGHPEGKCKKFDKCSVIQFNNCDKYLYNFFENNEEFVHLFVQSQFQDLTDTKKAKYNTCFYGGSSGSPVFNLQGKLLAMHQGGYNSIYSQNETPHVLEYGHFIYFLIKDIICSISAEETNERQVGLQLLISLLTFTVKYQNFYPVLFEIVKKGEEALNYLEKIQNGETQESKLAGKLYNAVDPHRMEHEPYTNTS